MKQRVRIERVSKRWQRLAVHHAWTDYKSLTLHFDESLPQMKDFNGRTVDPESPAYSARVHDWLYAILERCGVHLREIILADPPIQVETFALLGLAPNVKHLDITLEETQDLPLTDQMLDEIGRSIGRELKSLSFDGMKVGSASGPTRPQLGRVSST